VALARYDQLGNLIGSSQLGAGNISMAGGIATAGLVSIPFNILTVGTYSTNFSLNSSTILTNAGNTDLFCAWIFTKPQLTIQSSNSYAIATWPTVDGSQFILQGSSNFSSWTTLGSGTFGPNGQQIFTNTITPGVRFFRLLKN
jgi:hypothetical protein